MREGTRLLHISKVTTKTYDHSGWAGRAVSSVLTRLASS